MKQKNLREMKFINLAAERLRCRKQLQYYLHTGSSMSFLNRSSIV